MQDSSDDDDSGPTSRDTWTHDSGGYWQPRPKFRLRDFFRGRWKWVMLGTFIALMGTAGMVAIYPVVTAVTPAESHEKDARAACQKDILEQLDSPGSARFTGETAKEYGENNWNIDGTIEVDGIADGEYSCVYSGEKVISSKVR